MQELNTWTNLKAFVDSYNIVNILDLENRLISDCDISIQNQLAKSQHLYNRTINYVQSRRADYIQKTYFQKEGTHQ